MQNLAEETELRANLTVDLRIETWPSKTYVKMFSSSVCRPEINPDCRSLCHTAHLYILHFFFNLAPRSYIMSESNK